MRLTVLYRPTGQAEYDMIKASGFLRFPPRLPSQPYFYPVTSEAYAKQIARDWNAKDENSGRVGYVLQFHVQSEYVRQYPPHVVGRQQHNELWIPAPELEEFNNHIEGTIEVIAVFRN